MISLTLRHPALVPSVPWPESVDAVKEFRTAPIGFAAQSESLRRRAVLPRVRRRPVAGRDSGVLSEGFAFAFAASGPNG